MINRIPAYVRWTFLAVALWCTWGIAVRPFFARRIAAANQQHADSDRQLAEFKNRIGQAPMLLRALDSCRHVLDSCLASFTSSGKIDELTTHLRETGKLRGLADPHAEPELPSLLNVARTRTTGESAQIHLDTIIVALSAHGGFFELGAWLDEVERRPDFRTWISCRWNRSDEDEGVGFEGKAILLVLGEPESIGGGRVAGM